MFACSAIFSRTGADCLPPGRAVVTTHAQFRRLSCKPREGEKVKSRTRRLAAHVLFLLLILSAPMPAIASGTIVADPSDFEVQGAAGVGFAIGGSGLLDMGVGDF